MSTTSTKAEQAREFFRALVAEGFDFRNTDARIKRIKDFCISKKWIYETDRAIFYQAFRQVLKEQGIDPKKFEIKPQPTKYSQSSGKLDVTVEPKPKSEQGEAPKTEAPKTEGDKTGAETTTQEKTQLSISTIANIFDVPVNIINIRYPRFKKLSPEEKQSLAESWKPIFDKYLTMDSKYAIWIAPLITTLGVFASRADAFTGNKTEESKEEEKEEKPKDKTEETPKNSKWLETVKKEKKNK